MNKIELKNLLSSIENKFNLTATHYEDSECIIFETYTPQGQDVNIEVNFNLKSDNAEDIRNNLIELYEDYDVSYNTYIWLDEFGNGKNGAPEDMRDLYNDMEWVKNLHKQIADYIAYPDAESTSEDRKENINLSLFRNKRIATPNEVIAQFLKEHTQADTDKATALISPNNVDLTKLQVYGFDGYYYHSRESHCLCVYLIEN